MKVAPTLPRSFGCLTACLLALSLSFPAYGSDRAREMELESAIVGSLVVGEAVTLEANGASFLALYAEAEGVRNRGVAILLHGLGSSPVQPSVIEPLRTGLPEHGWGTLSLQMPVLGTGAEVRDYYPLIADAVSRIKAAITFLEAKKIEKIALIGHSMGALMGVSYLADEPGSKVSIAVMVGLIVPPNGDASVDVLGMLPKVDRPLLDLYGSRDLAVVIKSAKKRREAAANNRFYQQAEIDSANHLFRGLDAFLVARVSGWMNRMTEMRVTITDKQTSKEIN